MKPSCMLKSPKAILIAVGTLTIVHAEAPPDATIPRVQNPPLAADLPSLPGDLRASRATLQR